MGALSGAGGPRCTGEDPTCQSEYLTVGEERRYSISAAMSGWKNMYPSLGRACICAYLAL